MKSASYFHNNHRQSAVLIVNIAVHKDTNVIFLLVNVLMEVMW